MKKALFALLFTLFASNAFAQQESQTGYNFLRLPVSAHAAALGGNNISLIEDDASLIFHNPALLASVSDKSINLNYMYYMKGVNVASAAFNRTINDKASWAVSGQYVDYGSMKEADADNNITGSFTAKDIAITGYFSYMLSERIAGGIAAKFITSHIGQYNSMAVGVDLGVNYYDPEHEWSVSLVAKNLGGEIKAYEDDFVRMPTDVQAGVSKQLTNTPFRFSATLGDLAHWDYKFINHVSLGVDCILSDQIWIGGGYNFRQKNEMSIINADDLEEENSHGAGMTLGAGINLERFKINISYGKYHVSSSSLMINLGYTL